MPPRSSPASGLNSAVSQSLNRAIYLGTVARVRGGQMTEAQGSAALRKAGFPDSHNPFMNADAPGVGGVLHAAAVPLGLSRSHNIAVSQPPQDVARRAGKPNPVISAGTVTPGTGIVAQTAGGLAQHAVYAPGGVEQAVVHPVRTVRQAGHIVEQAATDPLHHPANAALLASALLSGAGSGIVRLAGAGRALKAGEGVRAAATRSGAEGGSLLHSPEPGTYDIHVRGARPTATGKNVQPGTPAEGPVQGVTVGRPLSRNPIVRQVQKGRGRLIQRNIDRQVVNPRTATGEAVRGTFSARSTVGRELRAQQRVENAVAAAPRHAQTKAVQGVTRGLSRGEHAAVGVVGVEGANAFKDPAGVIGRHIATHQHFANLGGDVTANEGHIADLKLAQHALEHPSPRFKKAIALTKDLSKKTEKDLIDAGHLNPVTAVGRRDKIAQIYGLPHAPHDSFYFPLSRRYTDETLNTPSGAYQARPGQYGRGPTRPSAHVQGLHTEFTGESVARGRGFVNVAHSIADRDARVQRLLSSEKQYDRMWKVGNPVRQSKFDVPIRDTVQVKNELRQFYADIADRIHATPDEMARLNQAEHTKLTDMLAANEHADAGVGAHIPGVRWIDRRYMADLGETNVRGPIDKLADAINNPIRAADIYLTPGYALNLAGNLGMQGVTEGARVFPNMRRAVTATRTDGPKNVATIDSIMGVSQSRALSVPTGPYGQMNQHLAEAWNQITDMYSRRSAFYHEAGKAGFKTPQELDSLLTDPANRAKLVEVSRRANKNIVDYGSMTPLEKNTIRRLIFFYPWVSRGTLWALRTMVENPGKVFALSVLGEIGAQNAHKAFPGGLPKWADQTGLIPVGKSHGDLQKVLNLSSVNTYSTAAQAGRAVVETGKGLAGLPSDPQAGLASTLTPGATLFAQAAGAGTQGAATGIPGLAQGLPQWQAARRGGLVGKPSASYPETGVGPALGPYAAHGAYPRGISKSALHNQYVKELPSDKRAAAHVQDDFKKLTASARAAGVTLPPGSRKAYGIQAQREAGYAKLGKNPTQQDRLGADLALAVKLGDLKPQDANEMRANAGTATDDEIKSARRQINQAFFYGKDLSELRRYVKIATSSRAAQPARTAATP